MQRDDPNREYVLVVAAALGDLCNEIVFVGGSVAGLLLTDPIAEGIRATKDVDAIVEVATLGQYHKVEQRLPTDPAILGAPAIRSQAVERSTRADQP